MAEFPNPDVIVNPISGQSVRFVSTTPEKLETRFEIESGHAADPRHIHPLQTESISVIEGRIRRSLANGSEDVLEPGQKWEIPPGTPHTWTAVDSYVHLRIDFQPALRTRLLLTRLFGLAQAGKLNSKGIPSPLQITVIALEYEPELRLASPPWVVQRLVLSALAPLATLLGYRP